MLACTVVLLGAPAAHAAAPAPLAQRIASARVDVPGEAVRRDLFVAADAARLARPDATTDLVLERLLAALYARNPGLSAGDAVAAIGDLRDAATLPGATTLAADGANGRIERVLAALAATHPTGAVAAALGSLAADALAPSSARLPGDRAIALGGDLDTLTDPGAAFDPAAVLLRSAQLAAASPAFAQARDMLWQADTGASIGAPAATLLALPALDGNPDVAALAARRDASGGLHTTAGALAGTPGSPAVHTLEAALDAASAAQLTAFGDAADRQGSGAAARAGAAAARETFAALAAGLLADGGQPAYASDARQAIATQDRAITALGAYATGDRSAAALGDDLAGAALDLLATVDARYAAATAPASADPPLRALHALSTQAGGSGLAAALGGADAELPARIDHLAGLAATLDAVAADPTLAAAQLRAASDRLTADRLAADALGASALTALTGPLASAIADGLDGDATLADATAALATAASDADGWAPAATGVPDAAAPGRWALAARGLAALAVARPGALTAIERDRLDAASATGAALQTTLAGIGPLGDELCTYRTLALDAGGPGCPAPAGGPQTVADALDAAEQAARDAIAGSHAGDLTGTLPTKADGSGLDLWGAPTQGSDFAATWAAHDDTATPCRLGADPYGTSSHIPNPKDGVSGAITPPASVTPDIVPPAYGLADRLGLGSLALCWTLENRPASGPQVDFKWFYAESADHRLATATRILPFPVAEQVFRLQAPRCSEDGFDNACRYLLSIDDWIACWTRACGGAPKPWDQQLADQVAAGTAPTLLSGGEQMRPDTCPQACTPSTTPQARAAIAQVVQDGLVALQRSVYADVLGDLAAGPLHDAAQRLGTARARLASLAGLSLGDATRDDDGLRGLLLGSARLHDADTLAGAYAGAIAAIDGGRPPVEDARLGIETELGDRADALAARLAVHPSGPSPFGAAGLDALELARLATGSALPVAITGASPGVTPTFAGTTAGDAGTVTVRVVRGTDASAPPVQQLTATPSAGAWSATAAALDDGIYTAQALRDDGDGHSGASPALTFTVMRPPAPQPAPQPAPAPSPPPGPGPVAPTLRATLPSRFAAAKGAKLALVASARSTVTATLRRTGAGHRRGARCLPGKPGGNGRACTALLERRTVTLKATAGRSVLAFGRGLHRGRWVATLVAADRAGLRSAPVTLRFRVA